MNITVECAKCGRTSENHDNWWRCHGKRGEEIWYCFTCFAGIRASGKRIMQGKVMDRMASE